MWCAFWAKNRQDFATLPPQMSNVDKALCSSQFCCDRIAAGRRLSGHDLTLDPVKPACFSGIIYLTRRLKCPKALSCLQLLALWLQLRPALAAVKKNLLWLSPSPSRLNQPTPVSSSNSNRGPALWPGPCTARGAGPEALTC